MPRSILLAAVILSTIAFIVASAAIGALRAETGLYGDVTPAPVLDYQLPTLTP